MVNDKPIYSTESGIQVTLFIIDKRTEFRSIQLQADSSWVGLICQTADCTENQRTVELMFGTQ